MELRPCPACDRQLSPAAASCPGCGHTLKAPPSGGFNADDPVHLIGVVLLLAFAAAIYMYVTGAI